MTIGKSPPGDSGGPSDRPDPGRPKPGPIGSGPTGSSAAGPPGPGSPPPAADQPTIGHILAAARLAAGLTVDQISASTRVRVPIVHAIEEDHFDRCGGDFYARGHIRSLARAVGVDGEALVARYDAEHGGAPSSARPAQIFDVGHMRADRRRPNWTAAMIAAIVAVIALIGFNLAAGGHHGPGSGDVASSPLPGRAPSRAPGRHTPPGVSRSPIAAAPAGRVTVKIVGEGGRSWVSALDGDGRTLFSNVLAAGDSRTFTDPHRIRLVVGNAGSVHLYVNGKDLGPAGRDGQVVRLTYTPGDPEAA